MRLKVPHRKATPTIEEVIPYLPRQDGFVDIRHLVWESTDKALPFSVTTRIAGNNQQWLITHAEN